MSIAAFDRCTATITELSTAEAFCHKYRGRVLVDNDGDFIVNSLYTETGGQRRFIAKGANVAESFILHKIRQLVIELSDGADTETKIRVQTAAFVQAVLGLIRNDPRFELPPHTKDEPRLVDLDALVERRVEHFRESEHA